MPVGMSQMPYLEVVQQAVGSVGEELVPCLGGEPVLMSKKSFPNPRSGRQGFMWRCGVPWLWPIMSLSSASVDWKRGKESLEVGESGNGADRGGVWAGGGALLVARGLGGGERRIVFVVRKESAGNAFNRSFGEVASGVVGRALIESNSVQERSLGAGGRAFVGGVEDRLWGGYLVTEARGVACIQPGRLQRLLPDPGPVVVGDVVAMRRREQLNGLVRSWVEPAGAVSELPGDRVAGLTGRDVVLKGSLGVSGLFSLGDVLPKDGGAHEGTRGVKPDESVGAVGAGVVVAGYRKVAGELAVSGAGSGLGGGVRNGDAGAISPIEVLVAVSLARACTGAAGGGRGRGGVVGAVAAPRCVDRGVS